MISKSIKIISVSIIALSLSFSVCYAQATAKHKFVGSKKCSMCHKGESKGNVYEKWQSSPHAKAFQTLSNAQSDKIAKEKGLKTPANQAKECLDCHASAYGVDAALLATGSTFDTSEGISCEECHGAGGDYLTIHAKKDLAGAKAAGMVIPKGDEKSCTKCHNKKSPTFKSFNYKEAWAKISHPMLAK